MSATSEILKQEPSFRHFTRLPRLSNQPRENLANSITPERVTPPGKTWKPPSRHWNRERVPWHLPAEWPPLMER